MKNRTRPKARRQPKLKVRPRSNSKAKAKLKVPPKLKARPKLKAQLYHSIPELLTLVPAAQKSGRKINLEDLGEIKRAAMVVEGGRILFVGAEKGLKLRQLKEWGVTIESETRCDQGAVLPGFIESHTHLVYAGDRQGEFESRSRGKTYQEIAAEGGGIRSTVRATSEASEKELIRLAQERVDGFVAQGVTTIEVKSGYGLNPKSEMRLLKVASRLRGPDIVKTYLGLHTIEDPQQVEKQLVDQIVALDQVSRRKLAERVDIFVEKGFFTISQLERWAAAAAERGLKLVAHVDQLSKGGGARRASELRATSVDHAVHLTEAEISGLARSETTAVLLPAADFYMKISYPRARQMIDAGVRVALATDLNPGTSPCQDLSLVGVLARLEMKMTLPEVISSYTVGAAHALGRHSDRGSLAPNMSADFVCLNGSWRELFYRVGHHPVERVFRRGRKICHNLSWSTKKSFAKA